MAITTPTIVNELPIARSGPFSFNNDEGDGDPAVECVAAPGAGKALYLTHVTIAGRTTDVAVTVQDEDATVLYGPIQCQADGGSILTKDWKFPLKLTDNKALDVFATNGVAFTIYGEYFIGQSPIA
ncbi:MAG: hypothetical protein DRI30_04730 [Chloroflexi bacterium]|nr:MAG: hypothetical protein DRI30_04730 [Chloroflexota bacterium]